MTQTFDVGLVLAEGEQRRPVVATVTADATVGALAEACAVTAPLYRFEQVLDPASTLTAAGVVSGDVLGVGAPVRVDWRQLGAELRVVGGASGGLRRRIDGGGVVVGRGEGADVRLADPLLSRRHFEVRVHDDGFAVRDLGSRHGVRVDGGVAASDAWVVAPLGAAVRAGDHVFTVVAAEAGVSLRRADPFHLAFTGGRPPRAPEAPADPVAVRAPTVATRRSLLPYLVPSAGAAALAATASGAPPAVAFTATPAALLVAVGLDKALTTRAQRRSTAAHDAAASTARAEHRARLDAYARDARRAHPDPASAIALAEQRGLRMWSVSPAALTVRVGLRTTDDGVQIPHGLALGHDPLVVAGSAASLDGLFRWLVAQVAVLVSPRELDIVVVSDRPDEWAWTAWLPHRSTRTVLPVDATPSDLPARRAARRLVVLDGAQSPRWEHDPSLAPDDVYLWRVRDEDGAPYRASAVVSAASAASLRVEDDDGVRDDVLADGLHDPDAYAVQCGLALARVRTAFGAEIDPNRPIAITDVVPALARPDDVVAAWRRPPGPLRAVLGVAESGPLEITLDGQNSHALVAGTTGSGKTRLLETLVLSLAATRSPAELSVLIIDFKGGNELAALGRLPHCVGVVSDRNLTDVDRAISALTREIARRDELFAAANASDLGDYTASTGAVMPRLVVVADEFGQFKRDDAMGSRVATLLRIAAQGRSKGIHLVLATQSPSTDVTAEIRQNVGVRMCLRVAEVGESVAVLGVPDAAALPGPGHVVVSVDNERRVGRVATAHVGVAGVAPPVRVVSLRDAACGPVRDETAPARSEFDGLLANLRAAAGALGVAAPTLLPPPLPDAVARRALRHADRPWTAGGLVLGQRDRPGIAEPPPFVFEPARDATLLVVGGPRSGRTTALLTAAEAARDQAGDGGLLVHAVAWSEGLEAIEGSANDAGVVRRGDYDHLRRTVAWLGEESSDRATRLVLIDRVDLLLRDARDVDPSLAAHLLEVLHDGPRRGIATIATSEPSALLTGAGAISGSRLVLPIDDPTAAIAAGLPRRPGAGPGRGVAPNGDDVQIGVPGAPTPVTEPPAARVTRMPRVVARHSLGATDGERIALGLGGRTQLAPLHVDLDEAGPVVVVIGRAGSGRSCALAAFEQGYRGARRIVRLDAGPSGWSPTADPTLLLVDDAARLAHTHAFLGEEDFPDVLRRGGHVAVVAYEQGDLTALGYRHWLTRRTYPGLLLSLDATPDRIVAGERLGFLPPGELRAGPPGRGWWCWRGAGVPVQVAAN